MNPPLPPLPAPRLYRTMPFLLCLELFVSLLALSVDSLFHFNSMVFTQDCSSRYLRVSVVSHRLVGVYAPNHMPPAPAWFWFQIQPHFSHMPTTPASRAYIAGTMPLFELFGQTNPPSDTRLFVIPIWCLPAAALAGLVAIGFRYRRIGRRLRREMADGPGNPDFPPGSGPAASGEAAVPAGHSS